MTDNQKEALTDRLHRALDKSAHTITRLGPTQWGFTLKNGELLNARAWLEEGWLHLAADAGKAGKTTAVQTAGVSKDLAWACLQRNGTLPGGVKYALDPEGRLQIRAELPLFGDQNETDIRAHLTEICAGMQTASHRLPGGPAKKRLPKVTKETDGDETSCDLKALCEETGWPFTVRSSGKVVFTLDTHDGFYQATLERRSEGVHVTAGLGTPTLASKDSRVAVAVLLLTLGGVVRMVRAAVEECDGPSAIRLEACLGRRPAGIELTHALAALSIGCRLSGREVEVLEDGEIAAEYLALRGMSS